MPFSRLEDILGLIERKSMKDDGAKAAIFSARLLMWRSNPPYVCGAVSQAGRSIWSRCACETAPKTGMNFNAAPWLGSTSACDNTTLMGQIEQIDGV